MMEIRGDLKVLKVFYGDRLDFIDEWYIRKEIFFYLISEKVNGEYCEFMKLVELLDLD